MSVKGFKLDDGSIAKYDYNSLENITTDTTLSSSGVAADAKAVGDELSDLLDQIGDLSDTVDGNNTTVTNALSELEEGKLNYIGIVPSSGFTTAEITSTYGSAATVVQEVWSSLPIGHTPFVVKIAATGGNLLCLGMRYGDTGQYGMLYFNHYAIGFGSVNVNNNVFTEFRNGVIEHTSENGWYYKKYADGTFDMWKKYSGAPATGTHYSTYNNFYGYYIQTGNFPTNCKPIDTNYCIHSTWQITNGFAIQAGHLGATTTTPGNL